MRNVDLPFVQHILRNSVTIYIPLAFAALIALLLVQGAHAFPMVVLFILIQGILSEAKHFLGHEHWFSHLNLEVAPFAAIFLGYYQSFWAGVIGMLVPLWIQDFDRDTSVFVAIEDIIFNVIIAGAAALLTGFNFFTVATILLLLRYFVLGLLHPALLREFHLVHFTSKAVSACVFLVLCHVLQTIFSI